MIGAIMIRKRFIFSALSVICVTITTILLKYDGEVYLKLIGTIVGVYQIAQSVTDMKGVKNGSKG